MIQISLDTIQIINGSPALKNMRFEMSGDVCVCLEPGNARNQSVYNGLGRLQLQT